MHKLLFSLLIFFTTCFPTFAEKSLPGNHTLLQNDQGHYFIENKDGIIMVDPAILSIGHSKKWIVACSKNESIDTDLKRYFFINLKLGGTTDTINQESWDYFKSVYSGLGGIELINLTEEECP